MGCTHDGSAERVEGVGPTGVEVGAVQPLQEPHVVEALSLRRASTGVTTQEKRGQPLPGTHPAGSTLLFLPFCRQSICFSGEASQWICKGKRDCYCMTPIAAWSPNHCKLQSSSEPSEMIKSLYI